MSRLDPRPALEVGHRPRDARHTSQGPDAQSQPFRACRKYSRGSVIGRLAVFAEAPAFEVPVERALTHELARPRRNYPRAYGVGRLARRAIAQIMPGHGSNVDAQIEAVAHWSRQPLLISGDD